jgi:ABC-2 type transport system ATP-binding protein
MDSCAAEGTTVVLSSHLLADLERVCDFLIVLAASRVQVADDIASVLAGHRLLIAPRRAVGRIPGTDAILTVSQKERQTTVLVRTSGAIADPTWEVHQPTLEEIVLGYFRQPGSGARQPLVAVGGGAGDSPAEAAL